MPADDDDDACVHCGGAGWLSGGLEIVSPSERRQRLLRCRCNPEKPKGIPLTRMTDTFEAFRLERNPGMREAYERCVAVAEGREWRALLVGPYGIGKSHLAIAALLRFGRGQFWKAPDLLDAVRKAAYGDFGKTDHGMGETAAIEPYRTDTGLLVVDDLGVQKDTEFAVSAIYRILDYRYEHTLPTIITTNVAVGRLDGRIFDRYGAGMVSCGGASVRLAL